MMQNRKGENGYLKIETSHSQEWLDKAMKKHTAAANQTTATIKNENLDTF